MLYLMAAGETVKSAAARMGCSPHTVNFHARCAFKKLHAGNITAAVATLLRSIGIVTSIGSWWLQEAAQRTLKS